MSFGLLVIASVYLMVNSGIPGKQESSLTGSTPGLKLLEDTGHERALISYTANDYDSVLKRVQNIDLHMAKYRKRGNGGESPGADNRVACGPKSGPLGEHQVCDVPVDDFHPCTSSNQYNYEQENPCVFLKLDEIYNWIPSPFNTTNDLPADMPPDLKIHIKMVAGRPEANVVWVSCEGENPADQENIGPLQYIPRRGLPTYYYPFTNKEGYLSPLVAVLFEKPRSGVLINIVCKAWAKNITSNVRFGLKIDRS